MNYNIFLSNAVRSDVIGKNMSTTGKADFSRPSVEMPELAQLNQEHDKPLINNWDIPKLGMSGVFACGHEVNYTDVIALEIAEDDKVLEFVVTRNQWTPAYMDTYYRCTIDHDYYPNSGCISIREKKCITEQDVFVSQVTLINNKRHPVTMCIKVITPFKSLESPFIHMKATMAPRALKVPMELDVTGALVMYPNEGDKLDELTITLPAFTSYSFSYALAFHPTDPQIALSKANQMVTSEDPFKVNEGAFNRWMDTYVPKLETENQDMLKIYYYRWFLVWRNLFKPEEVVPNHIFKGSCFYEAAFGDWFGAPVGASVPMQILESRWMRDAADTYSFIENWKSDIGTMHHYIQNTPFTVWQLHCLHPNKAFLKEHYSTFVNYTKNKLFLEQEDKRPVTRGSWITACEYQPSFYQHAIPKWDWRQDIEGARTFDVEVKKIYRVDEIVFAILNLQACAKMAQLLEHTEDIQEFKTIAEHLIDKLKTDHWDEKTQMFYDTDYPTNLRCDEAACFDGFLPYLGNALGDDSYTHIFEKLFDINWFWGEFPITTAAKNCPMFWPDNCIAGPCESSVLNPHNYGASWNGTVWPYTNAYVCDALGAVALHDESRIPSWLMLFEKYTELHFFRGNRSLPNIVEHYHYSDGSSFSPSNDYFHSTWINLFMQYWIGIGTEGENVTFKPFTKEDFKIKQVAINHKKYTFTQKAGECFVEIED